MTGKVDSGSMKLSSCALPSSLSPVMRMTYLLLAAARSGLALTRAWRMRSAWSMFSQKTMVLAKRSVALRNSVILAATSSVRFSRIRLRSKSRSLYSRSSMTLAVLVGLALLGAPAVEVFVEADADDLVGREEAVGDALLERVGVDRVAEVLDVGNVSGFLGRGGQADLGRRREVLRGSCARRHHRRRCRGGTRPRRRDRRSPARTACRCSALPPCR